MGRWRRVAGRLLLLRDKQLPPLDLLRQYRVPIALASDLKSRHLSGVVPASDDEYGLYAIPHDAGRGALAGVTLNGAKALGLDTV